MNAVIDAAALLCVNLDEPGSEQVLPILRDGLMSALNLFESCSRGYERGVAIASVVHAVRRFELVVVPFDAEQAIEAAELRQVTRTIGVSLGDRACLALGRRRGVPIFTGDRRMARVDPALGLDVRLIR